MKISVELSEDDIRSIIARHLTNMYGVNFPSQALPIQVKSKQNYRSEWEEASIRINAVVTKPEPDNGL